MARQRPDPRAARPNRKLQRERAIRRADQTFSFVIARLVRATYFPGAGNWVARMKRAMTDV
jgi:hypothetical protein